MEKLKSFIPLNWALMANPFNWAIIVLMITIGGFAIGLIFHPANNTSYADDE